MLPQMPFAPIPSVPCMQQAHPCPPMTSPPVPLPADLLAQNRELQAFCRRHGIQFQAYSSLGGQYMARAVR